MASLKDVKSKISGVKKTSQITKAMNMVAAAKLRGAQQRMERFRDYADKFSEAMGNLAGGMDAAQFPLMEVREVKAVTVVVVSSDRGLCGSFNGNIFKEAERMVRALEKDGKTVNLVCVGRKANAYFSKRTKVLRAHVDIMNSFQMVHARDIVMGLANDFLSGACDEVQLVSSRFKSVAMQRVARERLLPVRAVEAGESAPGDYIYEPDPAAIFGTLLPLSLNVQVYRAMLEVSAGEHAARMTAMDNATTACGDIIRSLTLLYNKARQSAITAELMDIVGGAEALKG